MRKLTFLSPLVHDKKGEQWENYTNSDSQNIAYYMIKILCKGGT